MNVLYEDNHLIAVWKDAGVLTQASRPGEDNLLDRVKQYIKVSKNKPGNVFVGLLHRLDRNVSGIVLFAKTSKGASRLSEQIRARKIQKTYQARVSGNPKPEARLEHYLVKDPKNNITSVFDSEAEAAKSGGKPQFAALSYKTIESDGSQHVLEVALETGRSHQIRAQLAHVGIPIVGDTKYGGEHTNDRRIHLAASKLAFRTATGDKPATVEAPKSLVDRAIL